MTAWSAIIDPVSEDADNYEIELAGSASTDDFFLRGIDLTPPPVDPVYADSIDVEGAAPIHNRYKNRTIKAKVRIVSSSAAALLSSLADLTRSVGKIHREGGTLEVTTPSGYAIVFDLVDAQVSNPIERDLEKFRAEAELVWEALPFGRQAETLETANAETTLPVNIQTLADVPGDVPALGRMIVTDVGARNKQSVLWGIREYDDDAEAALFFQGESRTPLNGAATVAVTGASGSGNNVLRAVQLPYREMAMVPFMSTQAVSGGADHKHVGEYRVFARVQPAGSEVNSQNTLQLAWTQDVGGAYVMNDPVALPALYSTQGFAIVDLGQITVPRLENGEGFWRGVFLHGMWEGSSSTPGIDCYWLEPIGEGSGKIVVDPVRDPFALDTIARDSFITATSALNGVAAGDGGNWATSGSATDFQEVAANGEISRNSTSDATVVLELESTTDISGRLALLTQTNSDVYATLKMQLSSLAASVRQGLVLRYTSISQWVLVYAAVGATTTTITVHYSGDADSDPEGLIRSPSFFSQRIPNTILSSVDDWRQLDARLDADGLLSVWYDGVLVIDTYIEALDSGGSLASGTKCGIFDANLSATACTRKYKDFAVITPPVDAAIFASQSIEIGGDGVCHENAGGTLRTPRTDYEGDYFTIPPAGPKDRTSELIVAASRGRVGVTRDVAIDDLTVQVGVTPRWLVVPDSV